MKVIVEVGGWEHECCGPAIERGDSVTFTCIRHLQSDGQVRLIESHHGLGTSKRIQGRVLDLHVVEEAGATRPVLRVPSGAALCGNDPEDAGHLQDPGTGEVAPSDSTDFLVTVLTDR